MPANVMLLSTIDEDRLRALLADPGWCLQQKYDGVRVLLRCRAGQLSAVGRSGRPVDLGYVGQVLPRSEDYELDCELAWNHLYPFDDLSDRSLPYSERLRRVFERVARWSIPEVRRVRTWATPQAKAAALRRAQAERLEGVVLKRLDAAWKPGPSPDRAVRYKFVRRAEVVVSSAGLDGKRSARVGLYHPDGRLEYVGRVPLSSVHAWNAVLEAVQKHPSAPHPVIEVEYLYATTANRLFQPRLVRVRWDKLNRREDCPLEQLVTTHRGEIDGGPCQMPDPIAPPAPPAPPATPTVAGGRRGPRRKKSRASALKAVLTLLSIVAFGAIAVLLWIINSGGPMTVPHYVTGRGGGNRGRRRGGGDE